MRSLQNAISKHQSRRWSEASNSFGPMLFAHLKRILKLDPLRLRGPTGARDEFLLAATTQNLRKLAKLIPIPSLKQTSARRANSYSIGRRFPARTTLICCRTSSTESTAGRRQMPLELLGLA